MWQTCLKHVSAETCCKQVRHDVHESEHRDKIMKVTNNMQLYKLIYYSYSALHVLDDVFAHHQEHLIVFRVSRIIHPSCCRLVSWMSWNAVSTHPRRQPAAAWGEHYQILEMQSSAPGDGRKHRPKHVEPTWNNNLTYIVHLVGYFHSCITKHGFMNVKRTRILRMLAPTISDTPTCRYTLPATDEEAAMEQNVPDAVTCAIFKRTQPVPVTSYHSGTGMKMPHILCLYQIAYRTSRL